MSKLEESVNEILGLEGKDKVTDTPLEPPKEFKAPVQRKNGEVKFSSNDNEYAPPQISAIILQKIN